MISKLRDHLKQLDITKILFVLWTGSIFLPVRKVFLGSQSYVIGEYSDFLTYSLYLSQLLLLLLISRQFYKARELPKLNKSSIALFLVLLISYLFNISHIYKLNGQYLSYFAIGIVSYGTIAALSLRLLDFRVLFAKLFSFFGLFEAILAIYQFLAQSSAGLLRLGEPLLSGSSFGVAKIVSGGTFIRAYGTFPHPNLLGVFLFSAILFNIWLISNENGIKWRIFYYYSSLILSVFGLVLSFSRSVWLATVLGVPPFLVLHVIKAGFNRRLALIAGTIILSITACLFLFKPLLIQRSNVSGESFSKRAVYSKAAIEMIKDKPLFGVGAGESMLHMQQYSSEKLEPWDIQPIHNYYLISAAEYGTPVALALIAFFIWHIILAIKTFRSTADVQRATWNLLLATLLLCFMILMLFDHYFYTLMQTQFLLWMILGFIAGESMLHAKHKTEV
jgi:O-antigen ligase